MHNQLNTFPNSRSVFSFILYFIRKYPISFMFFFLAPTLLILEVTVIPYAIKLLIDALVNFSGDRKEIFHQVWPLFALFSGAWIALFGLVRIQHWWQAYIIPKFEADIRLSTLKYVIAHSYHFFSNQLSGNIASKINDLPKTIESIRMIICWHLIASLAIISATLLVMLTINIWCAAILAIWIIIHLFVVTYLGKYSNKAAENNAADRNILSGSIVDLITNIASVKLFANTDNEINHVIVQQNNEIQSNKKLILTQATLLLGMDIPVLFMWSFILYFLIVGWQQDKVTVGDIAFVVQSVSSIANNLWYMGTELTHLFGELGTAKNALTILNIPHEIVDQKDAKALHIRDGGIEFKHVNFGYKNNNPLFNDLNINIAPGTKIGLVGFSGSGKTTFAHLILRLYDIQSGNICIDDQPIDNVSQDSLHAAIAMVPQDTLLFHRTLMDNIRYARPDASDLEVVEASKQAHCHEFISQLPEGYQTLVGERGIKVSGGQRQRVAIARAILKDAKIVILDEATSALDSVTEKHIQEGLKILMLDRTTIIIAHRLSTLAEMDRILVFNKGAIVEEGTHEELLARKGFYEHMWQMQVGDMLLDNS